MRDAAARCLKVQWCAGLPRCRGAWEVDRVIVACVWPEEVLRVPRRCSDTALLRTAYKRVSMAVHPDKCHAGEVEVEVACMRWQAYCLLSQPLKAGTLPPPDLPCLLLPAVQLEPRMPRALSPIVMQCCCMPPVAGRPLRRCQLFSDSSMLCVPPLLAAAARQQAPDTLPWAAEHHQGRLSIQCQPKCRSTSTSTSTWSMICQRSNCRLRRSRLGLHGRLSMPPPKAMIALHLGLPA